MNFQPQFDNPDAIGIDEFLGFGNKTKKAEKKIRKADKQLAKGNVQAAQRKLDKAAKKIAKDDKHDTSGVSAKLVAEQQKVTAKKQEKQDVLQQFQDSQAVASSPSSLPGQVTALDPSTSQPGLTGTGIAGGGGGGGMDFAESEQDLTNQGMAAQMNPGEEGTPDNSNDMPNETKKGKFIVVIVILIIAGYFIFKKLK